MIELKKVTYSYHEDKAQPVIALDNINLTFREGEFVAIMGPNSCGKTTLVRTLNGLIIPRHGNVIVDKLAISEPENLLPIRKKVGMVFQNPDNQIVSTSVEREAAFGLENLGVPTKMIQQVVTAILQRFDLEKYRYHPTHLLSGGEKQRLALASVLAMNPKYLVLDEPTSMLDPKGRQDLMNLLNEIRDDNKEKKTTDQITTIMITQFADEALKADRLIVMDRGKIIFDDAPNIVFQNIEELKTIGVEVPPEIEILPLLLEKGYSKDVLEGFE